MRDALPFIAAIAMLSCGPFFTARAQRQIAGWIQRSEPYSPVPDKDVPDYLAPAQISVYIEYASDVIQITPAIALTVIGAVVALPHDLSSAATGAIIGGVLILAFVTETMVTATSPQRFVRLKVLRLSPVALTCIALNAAGLAFVVSVG